MSTPDKPTRPVTAAFYYKVRWGHHAEWLDLFRRNHWPVLREQVKVGRLLDVRLYEPRFHGEGRADWDVLVTIRYRDWTSLEAHDDTDIKLRLYPDQARFLAEEQRRFELLDAHWDVPLVELPLDQG